MMTKIAFINALKQSLRTEESAVSLYTKHVNSTLFLSNMSKETKEKINSILEILRKESQGHAVRFQKLIHLVEEGQKDVY